MLITIEHLRKLEADRVRARQMAEDADTRRDEAILMAIESGTTQAVIARELGLTPSRVSQIATAARSTRDRHVPAA